MEAEKMSERRIEDIMKDVLSGDVLIEEGGNMG